MFGFKKIDDEYTVVEEITNAIVNWAGLKMPKDDVKFYREKKMGRDKLWDYAIWNIFTNEKISTDLEVVFAGLDVYTAKTKLDSLKNELKKSNAVLFRILGLSGRYYVTHIPEKSMKKLRNILENHIAYNIWFDFNIDNMIKLPEAPKREKVKVPPLSPDSKIWKSMEAIVKIVTVRDEECLKKLREELSKELEVDEGSVKEEAYWRKLLGTFESQYLWLQDNFEAADVIEEVSYVVNQNIGLNENEKIDFSEFFVPDDVGTYKALSILAGELEDKNILLGLMESPDERNGHVREDITIYLIVAVHNGDKSTLEKLFADCGGAIHFDFNDPKRLAAPVRQAGVLINWDRPKLPGSDEE